MNRRDRHPGEVGPLYELLLRCCRANEKGEKSIPMLAKQIGLTSAAVYKWANTGHLPSWRVATLVENSGGQVELAEFFPFIFRQ